MDISRLREIYLFENLSERALGEVAALASTEDYKRGQRIFNEGDRGDKFYLILSGEVRISKVMLGIGEEALAVLKEGDLTKIFSWFPARDFHLLPIYHSADDHLA